MHRFEDIRPRRSRLPRFRQPRKVRVRVEKTAEEGKTFFDQPVDLIEAMAVLRHLLRPASRVKERADRRNGVVDLMIDDADRVLPDTYFLTPQLRRQPL